MRALITGGTRGIGEAIANSFRAQGVDVYVGSRSTDFPLDVGNPDSVREFFEENGTQFDIAILNAGGGGRYGEPDFVFQKNALSSLEIVNAVLPHMVKSEWGRVVAITSIYAHKGSPRPCFGMAKAAQAAMIASFSKMPEYVRKGITFNCVAPGHIDVGTKISMADAPLGRMGKPQEVASVVSFLCSPGASLVNGANIIVDGGESA